MLPKVQPSAVRGYNMLPKVQPCAAVYSRVQPCAAVCSSLQPSSVYVVYFAVYTAV